MGSLLRLVENQEQKVTLRLTDNLAEHDVLDSDDYYQFEGGAAAAVGSGSGGGSVAPRGMRSKYFFARARAVSLSKSPTSAAVHQVPGFVLPGHAVRGLYGHGFEASPGRQEGAVGDDDGQFGRNMLVTALERPHIVTGLQGLGLDLGHLQGDLVGEGPRCEGFAVEIPELLQAGFGEHAADCKRDAPNGHFTVVGVRRIDQEDVPLHARLVTLSACQTGRSVAGGGDELLGLIQSAVENVIRNALKHTAEDTAVEVTVATEEGCLRIAIDDRGPGVPEEAIDKIFQPFYRVEGSKSTRSGSGGIGLAIAERSVRLHGGTIKAKNRAGGGLSVEISLPHVSSVSG